MRKIKNNIIFTFLAHILVSISFGQINIKFAEPLKVDNFNFYIDTVYVAQEEQKKVGYHWLENAKDFYKIGNSKNISLGLQNFFDQSFPKDGIKTPLIIRVNKILYSASIVSDTFDVILHISFLSSDGETYHHLYTTSKLYKQIKFEPESKILKIPEYKLREAFTSCFNDFVNNYDSSEKTIITQEELTNSVLLYQNELEVLQQDRQGNSGYFNSFEYFSKNYFITDSNIGLQKVETPKGDYFYEAKNEEATQKCWLFFDGQNHYVNYHSKYYKLNLINGNKVQFSVPKEKIRKGYLLESLSILSVLGIGAVIRNNTDLNWISRSIIAFVIGGVVYYVTDTIINKTNGKNNSKKFINYELDLLTGYAYRIP